MRLFVCVQAVDMDDPLYGFFYTWLEEAAKRFTSLHVLALRVGRYALPENVTVVPMRRHGSRSRLAVIWTLLRESWYARQRYQTVFVRGEPHYILLAWWLWRLLGKRMVFWYAHWRVSVWAKIASHLAHGTAASVQESFRYSRVHPVFIGQGIDEKRFPMRAPSPDTSVKCLVFGRVMPSKHIEENIQAFLESGGAARGTLTIVGPRPDPVYEKQLQDVIQQHPAIQWGPTAIPYDQVPAFLSQYDVLLNAYPASLDKAIVEGMMSGLIALVATGGVRTCLPETLAWLYTPSVQERTDMLKRVFAMTPEERWKTGQALRRTAIQEHSLSAQTDRLTQLFCASSP